jgi:hypothetical protein
MTTTLFGVAPNDVHVVDYALVSVSERQDDLGWLFFAHA